MKFSFPEVPHWEPKGKKCFHLSVVGNVALCANSHLPVSVLFFFCFIHRGIDIGKQNVSMKHDSAI